MRLSRIFDLSLRSIWIAFWFYAIWAVVLFVALVACVMLVTR